MKKIFFLLFFVNAITSAEMSIHEYHIDFISDVFPPAEAHAYSLLKKDPLNKSINYLVIPWPKFIRENRLDEVLFIKLDGGFTICQDFNYKKIIPYLQKIGINVLFATHAQKNEQYENIIVLPFPHYACNTVSVFKNKDILYSFIGYNNNLNSFTNNKSNQIRNLICTMPLLENCIIKARDKWHYGPRNQNQLENNAQEFIDILSRSRFSLCPKGGGPNTIRFWESLQAGAIPLVIADALVLPDEYDWNKCVIWIKEENLEKDPSIINSTVMNITPEQEEQMRMACLHAYSLFSGENFVSTIRHYYDK